MASSVPVEDFCVSFVAFIFEKRDGMNMMAEFNSIINTRVGKPKDVQNRRWHADTLDSSKFQVPISRQSAISSEDKHHYVTSLLF